MFSNGRCDRSVDDVSYKSDSLLVEESETFNDPEHEGSNYVNKAETMISTHKDVTIENAFTINQNLQEHLKELKRKLERILSACRAEHKSNEVLVDNLQIRKQNKQSNVDQRSRSFYFAGKPYFKTMDRFAAPFNADYLYRFKAMKEYFPIDHSDPLRWRTEEKRLLKKGVTTQLVKFLSPNQQKDAPKSKRRKSILNDSSLESKTFNELFKLAQSSTFQIDWFTISTKYLSDRHSETECIGIFNNDLNPLFNRQPFTEEEDLKLLEVVHELNFQNWENIGLKLNGRPGYECIRRYHDLTNDNIFKNCKWTKEEDEQLIETVESFRMGTFILWANVTDKIPFRSRVQVYNRYMYTLKPDIKKERFTSEEDYIITSVVKERGPIFDKFVTKLLPGRTLPQIRHRYHDVLKHSEHFKEWTTDDDIKLMELTNSSRKGDWANVSKQLIHHTKQTCRSRYTTITKYLKKYPNLELKDVPKRARMQSINVKDDNWRKGINQSLEGEEAGPRTAIGLKLHEFFKYSYNFQLKPLCEASEPASDICRPINYMLRNSVYPKDHKLMVHTECRIIMAAINCEFIDDYIMPPNLNTALILRGLAIMYPDVNNDCEEFSHDSPALQLFKKRFSLLLYSSAVASQINFPVGTSSGAANMQTK